ncbi:MAG: hypothetical protein L0M04_13780 [Enterococcus sp.]|jgi:hypothetical protein|nr:MULTISPECIES: hypothetical protein [Enterococcus]MDN6003982.1 hypothetical protein [Enterococcus sp.]MDN6562378.1 hypothetical protein [Enterococcus sp.]MDN6584117.1 hypothetical protein [Enterococcus sp.]MDN6616679.1 hypothetical protein [Enterococcus sp.]MDN6649603.1 hypothetical protein [Enterococcus sp.]
MSVQRDAPIYTASYSHCFLRSSRESKPLRLREGEGGGSDCCIEGACSTATGGGIWLVPDARCSFPMGGAGTINDVWRIGELAPGIVENTGPFAADVSEAACSSDVSTTSVPSVAGLESIAKTLFTRDFLC